MKEFFQQQRPQNGLSYDEYKADWQEQKDQPKNELGRDERKMLHYLRYNWKRAKATEAAYSPSDELTAAVTSIDDPQLWMVITEPWCGDSAFNLPVIEAAAEANDQIKLRILHRDENLDIMDQYLTGESRSIPKLVAFSENGSERFQWGPRPKAGQKVFDRLKEEGHDKMEIVQQLIEWYEDGGYQHVDEELTIAITEPEASTARS